MSQINLQEIRRANPYLTYLEEKLLAYAEQLEAQKTTGTEAEVCADISARQAKGIAKYGVSVADNPLPLREWLQHAYEETLDNAVYLKRAITSLDSQPA